MFTFTAELIVDLLFMCAGLFLGVKYNTWLKSFWTDAQTLANNLKADAAAIEAKVVAAKAAVSK